MDERLIASFQRLSSWEQIVFSLKCQGESRDSIANKLGANPRQIEMILGNIYDKLGLAFLDDRQRNQEIYRVASEVARAEVDSRFHWPRIQDLPSVPAPEMPSQRAQSEARNDERWGTWPLVADWRSRCDSGTETSSQTSQSGKHESREEPVSNDRNATRSEGREHNTGGDSGRKSYRASVPQDRAASRFDVRKVGLGCLFPIFLAGLCVFSLFLILDEGSDEDVIAGDNGVQASEGDGNVPDGVEGYSSSDMDPLPTPTQPPSQTPFPTPRPTQIPDSIPRVSDPGEVIYSRFSLDYQDWAERDNWATVDDLLVHNGSGDPNPIHFFPYTVQRKNLAVEIEMRVHRIGGDATSGDVGALLRAGSESAYYLGLVGQQGFESAFAETMVFDPDSESWELDESLHASRLRTNVAASCQQQWCILRFEANGNQLRVLIGDEPVLETYDNRLLEAGDAGFFNSGFQIDVRDVRVFDLR